MIGGMRWGLWWEEKKESDLMELFGLGSIQVVLESSELGWRVDLIYRWWAVSNKVGEIYNP